VGCIVTFAVCHRVTKGDAVCLEGEDVKMNVDYVELHSRYEIENL
jgi:hypothetical protein